MYQKKELYSCFCLQNNVILWICSFLFCSVRAVSVFFYPINVTLVYMNLHGILYADECVVKYTFAYRSLNS